MNKEKLFALLKKDITKFSISVFYFLFIYTYFYIIAEKITIFSKGYWFDMMLTIGLVATIFFFFRNRGRNTALITVSIIKTVIYIADYMYIHKFYSPASAGDLLLNFRWLDFGGYGIGLNTILVLLIAITVVYNLYIIKFKEFKPKKRRVEYLFLSWLLLVPFVYTTYIGAKTYNTIEEYETSETFIFDKGMGKEIAPGEFIDTFGYSIFRYEDLNYVVKDIIYDFTR